MKYLSGIYCKYPQAHLHEIQGVVQPAGHGGQAHAHRFSVMSGEAVKTENGDHIHEVKFKTDFYGDHFHEFIGRTSESIPTGDRHVHFLQSETSTNEDHRHAFRLVCLMDDPAGP